MHDDWSLRAVNDTDLEDDGRMVGADHHRESFIQLEHPYRVPVGVDVLVADTVLAGVVRDDRLNPKGERVSAAALLRKLACCAGR